MNMTLNLIEAATTAHKAALAAQESMRSAARDRNEAVQSAHNAGYSVAELAEALGVNRYRIHAMLKAAQSPEEGK